LEARVLVKKEEGDAQGTKVETTETVVKTSIKEEPEHEDVKRVLKVDETTVTTNERVKRRRHR